MTSTATYLARGATAAEYLRHVQLARAEGRSPVPPRTAEQFSALHSTHPHLCPRLDPRYLEMMGLPAWFGRIEPFGEAWMERFLLTLKSDDEFRAAVRFLLSEGAK